MRSREHAALLLRKAKQDQFTMEKLLPDPASPDDVIGFHAQQAVEKMLKAVLASAAVRYRRTHDLLELFDTLRENNISYPPELEEVRRLTPFAAAFRYDDLPDDQEQPFERRWAMDCVRRVRAWVESVLGEGLASDP
jgi:HEPN domain-containing protein